MKKVDVPPAQISARDILVGKTSPSKKGMSVNSETAVNREMIEQSLYDLRHPIQPSRLRHLLVQRTRLQRIKQERQASILDKTVDNTGHKITAECLLLHDALAVLASEDKELSNLLLWHYRDEEKIWSIANRLAVQERTVYNRKNQALNRLTEIVANWEGEARRQICQQWHARLEAPTYQQLYGVTEQATTLASVLHKAEPPFLLAIEGIGGIGKTALADQLVRTAIDPADWDDFAWVTARQRVMNLGGGLRELPHPALTVDAMLDALSSQLLVDAPLPADLPLAQKLTTLRKRCNEARCLIVIDNLETVADVDALLETLILLSNPSKILMTSRQQVSSTNGVFRLHPPELSEADARLFLRSEATSRNLPDLAQADDRTLGSIYQMTGGHPLALRLVVGQTYLYPLETVLENLRAARGEAMHNLYQYIYQHSWENLDGVARHLLLILLTAPERGATLAYLNQIITSPNLPLPTGLAAWTQYDLLRGLETLVRLNLVDRRGDLHSSHYTLHSLTRAFLHEQVLQWR